MFIHWGVCSVPGRGEWVQWVEQIPTDQYAKLADQFHPEHFDADAWATIAHAGGMKYMVLTARHHDGFALFTIQSATLRRSNLRPIMTSWRTS
jgi:alpha-L-fucosidase